MIVRSEQPPDRRAIREIHLAAFDTPAEAALVERLRDSGVLLISLLAEEAGRLLGHILFSPVTLLGARGAAPAIAGLAPMAVLPERQHQGIGSRLVEDGLRACRDAGYRAVVVLGHPRYYPRFGFRPAAEFGLASQDGVPSEAFMALELERGALRGHAGTVCYHDAFASASL